MTPDVPQRGDPSKGLGLVAAIGLGACVFAAGAAVMIYEFIAVRLLAPFFGGTLDIWASEIAVCLGGLAAGYFAGGFLADISRSWRALGAMLLLAGLSALPMESIVRATGSYLVHVDTAIQWHPLIGAFAASFVPMFALGTILPQAIRKATRDLQHVGSSAGMISALSTVGSIAGALGVAQMLAHFGVRQVLETASLILVIAGLATLALGWKRSAVAVLVVFLAVPAASGQVLFEKYSAYHHILVEDQGPYRVLRFDNAMQSTMSLSDPTGGGFEYTDFFHVPMVFNPSGGRVLFIGLGGGTGPKTFLHDYDTVRVDVVEIDPEVVKVAKRYFAVNPSPRLSINVADGRVYLNRSAVTYSAIIVDAYASGPYGPYIPYHLATSEFFEVAWKHLENGGCVVFNAIGQYRGENADVIAGLTVTFRAVFQAVYVFRARSSINTVFVAMKIDPDQLDDRGLVDGRIWPEGPWLQHPLSAVQLQSLVRTLRAQGHRPSPGIEKRIAQLSRANRAHFKAPVLTDNYAPVDVAPRRR